VHSSNNRRKKTTKIVFWVYFVLYWSICVKLSPHYIFSSLKISDYFRKGEQPKEQDDQYRCFTDKYQMQDVFGVFSQRKTRCQTPSQCWPFRSPLWHHLVLKPHVTRNQVTERTLTG
jgi:hypothetical protein